jgi:hypothetical protein
MRRGARVAYGERRPPHSAQGAGAGLGTGNGPAGQPAAAPPTIPALARGNSTTMLDVARRSRNHPGQARGISGAVRRPPRRAGYAALGMLGIER